MPTTLADLLTEDILDLIKNEDNSTYSFEDMGAELKYRLIPTDDVAGSLTEYRGGIRPTHLPTH